VVAGKFVLAVATAVFCFAGCAPSENARAKFTADPAAARDSIVEQLRNERLPALLAVERWENRHGPGLRLTTEHYEILTTLLEPLMLRIVPGYVEWAQRSYNDQLPRPIETSTPFRIYLFADRQQWEDFTYGFAGDQAPLLCKIRSGAYYLNGACVVYNIGPAKTLSAIGHEGWHQFTSRHFRYRLPSWLDEGVAMLFEAGAYEGGLYRFDPAQNIQRLDALKETLETAGSIPLRELVATSPGEVLATDQTEAVMAFYSQSYALVRFLREADYGKRMASYRHLISHGLTGDWPLDASTSTMAEDRNVPRTVPWNRIVGPQLFEHYVGTDLDQLEREYLAFCRRLVREK